MTRSDTLQSYHESINRIYAYVDDNLAEDLGLAALTRVSGYSAAHLQRIFHALTGESLHEYVSERRLAAAARLLLHDRRPITAIALDCGFSSPSRFVHAFRRRFGCAPSCYRAGAGRRRPPANEDAAFKTYAPDPAMDALCFTRTLPDLEVVGIVCRGLSEEFESAEIADAFRRLFAWLAARALIVAGIPVIGVTLDTPEVLSLAECRYLACVPAPAGARPEGDIVVRTLPTAGEYVCFSLDRTQSGFAERFFAQADYLYGRYLPSAGALPDDRPFVEFYRQNGPGIEITFCVPTR